MLCPRHRVLGWEEKVNPIHLDGLLLEKTVAYDAERCLFTIVLAIVNLSDETKLFTPWLHNVSTWFRRWL